MPIPTALRFCSSWALFGSGLPENAARKIADKLVDALRAGETGAALHRVIMNPMKVRSAESVWQRREELATAYHAAEDRVKFLTRIKGIGVITAERLTARLGG